MKPKVRLVAALYVKESNEILIRIIQCHDCELPKPGFIIF